MPMLTVGQLRRAIAEVADDVPVIATDCFGDPVAYWGNDPQLRENQRVEGYSGSVLYIDPPFHDPDPED